MNEKKIDRVLGITIVVIIAMAILQIPVLHEIVYEALYKAGLQ